MNGIQDEPDGSQGLPGLVTFSTRPTGCLARSAPDFDLLLRGFVMRTRTAPIVLGCSWLGTLTHTTMAHELLVGRSGANQIVMHILVPMPFDLEPSPSPGFDGYAAADPGFVSLGADQPDQ